MCLSECEAEGVGSGRERFLWKANVSVGRSQNPPKEEFEMKHFQNVPA